MSYQPSQKDKLVYISDKLTNANMKAASDKGKIGTDAIDMNTDILFNLHHPLNNLQF